MENNVNNPFLVLSFIFLCEAVALTSFTLAAKADKVSALQSTLILKEHTNQKIGDGNGNDQTRKFAVGRSISMVNIWLDLRGNNNDFSNKTVPLPRGWIA